MTSVVKKINETIENIWITFELKEGVYTTHKLNNQQYVLLTLIIRHPSLSPTELAEKMSVTKSAVSQQLAKLEREDYIVRKQSMEDKRSYTIELGGKGLHYKKEMEAFNHKLFEQYNANLSNLELEDISSALEKLLGILKQL